MSQTTPLHIDGDKQRTRFLGLYALAAAGGSVSYAPFLSLVFPARVAVEWGDEAIHVLSLAAFFGAIAASLSNIAFGWLSDRTGSRQGWIVAGVIMSGGLLVTIQAVHDLMTLLSLIVLWQIGLNMMLGPLTAWAGDCVPDRQKGVLGGLLSISPAVGALMGAFVTIPDFIPIGLRPAFIAVCVATMVLPVVFFGRPMPMPQLMDDKAAKATRGSSEEVVGSRSRRRVAYMWMARLLVQIAEALLFAFQLFWFRSISSEFTDNDTAIVFAAVLCVSVPVALYVGRWSDRAARPLLPLGIATLCCMVGLISMALAGDIAAGIASYVFFGVASSVFLALHAGQTLRVLPLPSRRGRDLGIFNLTNTVPSLIMPWLALGLVPAFGFDALFLVLAALCAISSFLIFSMRKL